ncbi:site-specific integrase [Bacteroides thetaiotaomicron]|jgi:integrase|uniref:Site-specific integrase n=1 Tax=Bacteroides thetaiotaomicron TaxID=818 RepID=A0AAW4ZDX1_BACT4|nr:site-specific integrase [Bacteroides thetaiotaomicron]MCE9240212.1 site-specific integrase [Bacteroides thetaiotaomicron]MCE9269461.1 site-specific integrase [Bacteroides thetaiotaomicron]MCE9279086.1 site-specific integrase [Bacteroides thetaiotaomicron]MCE9293315.1 site-specific integrase [Bacteroides thetaiotaomicron]
MSSLKEIQGFTPPVLHAGKDWYIDFYAFDPVKGYMRRKKIKLNFIKKANERRKYARDYMIRLSEKLSLGWNPWIEQEQGNAYLLFKDVTDKYRTYIYKMFKDGHYRPETLKSYSSYLHNMELYNSEKKAPITYIYQFDKDFCVMLLEEVYITRDNTAFTRDNYLGFLKSFSSFCLDRNYLTKNPTEGISSIGRKGKKKIRTQLKKEELVKLMEYLKEKNPHFLLASYILYYCFIRPSEMSKLRLSNISLSRQTIFVPDAISKNKKDGTITLPAKVIHLMLDLNIFDMPNDYFLFSDQFKPGTKQRTEKMFRDWWAYHVRKDLKLPTKYKFYSLKDTGITNMLRHYDTLSVRDQARHSSILMTDIYTPHDIQEANDLIKNYEDAF